MLYYLLGILVFLFLSLIYTLSFHKSLIIKIDNSVLGYFHQIQNKSLDMFFSFITYLGSLWIILPLYFTIVFFLFKSGYKNLFLLNIMFFGAISSTYILKYLFDRKRPDVFVSIGDLPFDPSFPSAHTTQITIFCLFLAFLLFEFDLSNKSLYLFILFLMFYFVVSSRIYLQVHFFSDVLAGILISMIWFLAFYKIITKGI